MVIQVNRKFTRMYLFLFVLSMTLIGCEQSKVNWYLDSEYSMYLTIMSPDYKLKTGTNSADTVDALQIYRNRQKHSDMYSLSELFTKELVFETKDKQFIENFISSAQETIMHVENCRRSQDQEETFHVIAFDNTFMRAGYFLVNLCNANGIKYGIIHPLQKGGGSSIYYNKALIPIFKDELHLLPKT